MGRVSAMGKGAGGGGDTLSQEQWREAMSREDRSRDKWQLSYGGPQTPDRYTPGSVPPSRGRTAGTFSQASSRPTTGMSVYSMDSTGQARPVTSNTKERKLRELKGKLLGTLEEIERELVIAQDDKASRQSTQRSSYSQQSRRSGR